MISQLVLSCTLTLQTSGTVLAPDPAAAAAEAARRLVDRWSSEAAGPPGSVLVSAELGMPEVDRNATEDALRVRFAAEGIDVVRAGAAAEVVRVRVDRVGGEETLVLRAEAGPDLAVRVPFVRKPWVMGGLPANANELLVVASDLHSSEADARREAASQARSVMEQRLRLGARSRLPGVSMTRSFRQRIDREIARSLPQGSLAPRAVRDEFVESRIFSVGPMTRVHLLVDTSGKWFQDAQRRVTWAARSASREVVFRGGLVAAGWALLFFFCSVLDRLTRGYLTGRLRLISGSLGLLLLWLLWWV